MPQTLDELGGMMEDLNISLYKTLYLIRRAEELIIVHYHEDEMKTPMHMSMGQEAIPVGVCEALGEKGQIFASYRSHAAFLARTKDTNLFFAELCGRESGTAQGKSGSMHLAAPDKGHILSSAIVASCLPVAVGASFAFKKTNNGKIACVFFGDGAIDEGVFWESFNVACVMKLPVLFVYEDNGLAVHTPVNMRQGFRSITEILENFDCYISKETTTDAEVIYSLTSDLLRKMGAESKPAFLHFKCYRYLEHVGINEDFEDGYRMKRDFDEWYAKDPVKHQRGKLKRAGLSEEALKSIEQKIDFQIETSLETAKKDLHPDSIALFQGVFV